MKVLAAAAHQGTLQPLVYPTTQLLLGAARLVPTPRYFPIRLRLVRALNRLAQVGGRQRAGVSVWRRSCTLVWHVCLGWGQVVLLVMEGVTCPSVVYEDACWLEWLAV